MIYPSICHWYDYKLTDSLVPLLPICHLSATSLLPLYFIPAIAGRTATSRDVDPVHSERSTAPDRVDLIAIQYVPAITLSGGARPQFDSKIAIGHATVCSDGVAAPQPSLCYF